MKKKVVSVVLAAAMTTTLVAGCGSTGSADTAADTSAEAAEDTEATDTADTTKAATGDTIKVAVVKQMDHASLDEISNAVEEELDAIAAKNGVTIEYETYSGQGDQSVLNQIETQVVSEDVDVIIPIATLAAQVMANCAEETQTPVVYAAISDPDAAELTGIDYVTGTSDALNTDCSNRTRMYRKSDFSTLCPRQTPQSRSRMQKHIWMRRELLTKRRQQAPMMKLSLQQAHWSQMVWMQYLLLPIT